MTKPAANSIEGIAQPFVERIENLNKDLEKLKADYMNECKVVRGDIKEVVTEAKDKGVTSKALKGIVKYRALERKKNAIGDGLDIDEQSQFETLVAALGQLGGTPLGDAATAAAA